MCVTRVWTPAGNDYRVTGKPVEPVGEFIKSDGTAEPDDVAVDVKTNEVPMQEIKGKKTGI